MEKELYKAAVEGDIFFLNEALSRERDEYFLSLTTIGRSNIIHIAVQHGRLEFLKTALRCFTSLILQQNSRGDTPLHIAAARGSGNMSIMKLLVDSYKGFTVSVTCSSGSESENEHEVVEDHRQPPWEVKNLEGNTPLHVALIHGKVWLANYLAEIGPQVAFSINNYNEAPLHVAIKYCVEGDKKLAIQTIQTINRQRVGMTYKGCPVGEESMSIISLLLQLNTSAACWRDADHLTPLLTAACKSHLPAVKAIIAECPESVEGCDLNGGTILQHFKAQTYDEAKDLMMITEIQVLKDQQDVNGNTPVHIAVKDHNVGMIRALLESSANITVKNKDGVSAASLINQHRDIFANEKLEIGEIESDFVGEMPPELFLSAVQGDVNFLKQKLCKEERDYFFYRTWGARNIVHIACQSHGEKRLADCTNYRIFVEEALKMFPVLMSQVDSHGDTPLHIIVKQCKIDETFLQMCRYYFRKATEEAAGFDEELYCPPWRVKNVDGNTPLHIALQAGYIPTAKILVEFDPEIALEVNYDNETALHVLCRSCRPIDTSICGVEEIDFIIQANASAVDVHDSDGLTPLLKAANYGTTWLMERLLHLYPRLIMQCDPNGGTVLHRMTYGCLDSRHRAKELLKLLAPLCEVKDHDGNTPSHLAMEKRNFDAVKIFMEGGFAFGLKNNKGVMADDLLGSANNIPRKFQQFLWDRVDVAAQIFGLRTMCGIPTTEIKDYVNTMSVTAALLATITFTAAFTVPGGFDSQHGTPVLAGKAAFWVFMISDISGMCLSMMVLFSLLWVMTGDREEKVVLVDFSLFLLQASFYSTLLTFMTGLYVTTIHMIPWLAILPCVACSVLILLMHKRIVMGLVPCYQVIYSLYQLACYSINESIRYLRYKIPHTWGSHHISHSTGQGRGQTVSEESPNFFQVFTDK